MQSLPEGQDEQSCSMQMVFAFFDRKGLVYTCIVPCHCLTINANYTVVALVKFLKYLNEEEA
jgi:hypothetical protein